jgi:glycosyltransferase involved in cell wall biosynthesis
VRILLLSDWMSNRGGAEAYIVALRDALVAAGDDVKLITCGSASATGGTGEEHALGADSKAAQVFLQLVNPFMIASIRKALRSFRPDVVLVSQFAYHMSPAVFDALRAVPVVVSMMDYKAICPLGTRLLPDGTTCANMPGAVCRHTKCLGTLHWARDTARYALIRRGLSSARKVICASEWARSQLASCGIDAETVPLGITVPSGFQRNLPEAPVFAYFGRLSREKGVAVAIAALRKVLAGVPGARLRIIGDGPLRRDLERLVNAFGLGESVEFAGWLDGPLLEEKLADVWAVIAPSLWAEPFGLAAIESVMRGIPVIASGSGGFLDTIQDGVSGVFFPPGDVDALADRMESVAMRRSFPDLLVPHDVVDSTVAKYSIDVHAASMRSVLARFARTGMEAHA